jgi:hypothetical protein
MFFSAVFFIFALSAPLLHHHADPASDHDDCAVCQFVFACASDDIARPAVIAPVLHLLYCVVPVIVTVPCRPYAVSFSLSPPRNAF